MRIKKTKTKNSEHYSIIKDINRNGKRTTCIYENIGNYDALVKRAGDEDPQTWLNNYVKSLNEKFKNKTLPIIIKKDPNKLIEKNTIYSFNVGYLFLQKIYYQLGIDKICEEISSKYQFKYDFNDIMKKLLFSRIIYPSSKLKTLEQSKRFIEGPKFDYQHIERALPIISKEMDFIQSELYDKSKNILSRNNKILYYDCTNYYFEIESSGGLKQYGVSKENRPNPIVQMGLFIDGDGLPMAVDITPGNTNEQKTLIPLEEKIIKDFNSPKIVVCTDAGLSSVANRKFNNTKDRKFITTQSLKKLKQFIKEYALDLTSGWKLDNSNKTYDISKLRNNEELQMLYKDKIFYKERWIKENGLEQRIIITYSVKYQEYQRHIRNNQIERAKKIIESNPTKLGKVKQTDYKRFISNTKTTKDGEVAEENNYSINQELIDEEAKYDGLYAVCTNLEDDAKEIVKINHNRWEIEESFRIMKTDFKARPVFHSNDEMIKGHFITCFLALFIYRLLEKKLDDKYTTKQIIETLRNMELKRENNMTYTPNYIRTDITDCLHEKFGFRTDYEAMEEKDLKKILKQSKK